MKAHYEFGDGGLASRRLALLADVFSPGTERFLRDAGLHGVGRAIDLGCGPGYTTEAILRTLAPQTLLGIDASAAFLEQARQRVPSATFFEADVGGDVPAIEGADLVFARYLLSHLPQGNHAVQSWARRLPVGGVLLIEELEAIEPVHPPFGEYLGMVEGLLADQNMPLYAGRELVAGPDPPECERFFDRGLRFDVEAARAARMFRMNVPNWRRRPFILSRYGEEAIDLLIDRLDELAESAAQKENPIWTLRQIGWRRRA